MKSERGLVLEKKKEKEEQINEDQKERNNQRRKREREKTNWKRDLTEGKEKRGDVISRGGSDQGISPLRGGWKRFLVAFLGCNHQSQRIFPSCQES